MDPTMKIDRRSFPMRLETRAGTADGLRHIVGHAAVFNVLSEDMGFREVIRPGAFARAIETSDPRALWNHDQNYPLGRVKAGTLRVWEDNLGLAVDIIPPDTNYARDLLTSIERGDVDAMSFAFVVGKDAWTTTPEGETLREVVEVASLLDVSPVTYPAYAATEVSVQTRMNYINFRQRAGGSADVGDIRPAVSRTRTQEARRALIRLARLEQIEAENDDDLRRHGMRR